MATQLVIFDFDGTLFDTHASIAHCISLTFTHYASLPSPSNAAITTTNIPSPASIHNLISSGAGLSDTFTALHPSPSTLTSSPSTLSSWLTTYRTLYATHGQPLITAYPGAAALLSTLKSCNIPCAIVSNRGVAAVLTALRTNGLEDGILEDLIVGDKTPGATRKPDVGSYRDVLVPRLKEGYGVQALDPGRVLMVGDTVADVRFARNLGAKVVWCRFGYGERAECEELRPDFVVDGLGEVEGLVVRED